MKWQPISESKKKPKKGVVRLYTFAPKKLDWPEFGTDGYIEKRFYTSEKIIMWRYCDGFMDMPEFGEQS